MTGTSFSFCPPLAKGNHAEAPLHFWMCLGPYVLPMQVHQNKTKQRAKEAQSRSWETLNTGLNQMLSGRTCGRVGEAFNDTGHTAVLEEVVERVWGRTQGISAMSPWLFTSRFLSFSLQVLFQVAGRLERTDGKRVSWRSYRPHRLDLSPEAIISIFFPPLSILNFCYIWLVGRSNCVPSGVTPDAYPQLSEALATWPLLGCGCSACWFLVTTKCRSTNDVPGSLLFSRHVPLVPRVQQQF